MALWHKVENFASDLVIIAGEPAQQQLLLIRRKHPPFQDCWALPGGFVNSLTPAGDYFAYAETHLQAAVRELQEETGILLTPDDLQLIGIYDAWGRDPRAENHQRVITHAFLSVSDTLPIVTAGDDAADAQWFALTDVLNQVLPLAFDHIDMVRDAHRLLCTSLLQ